ncbi:hypothetical protein BX616_005945 [Lobosporangium transversale]|uniref:Uncharacterized protein n=1 Tax=Lobosporangium transversale TaxID=64571 RepID=A0A1Y2GYV0_9FUNG|nr:hypothetical protein BCR41DRAFT_398538 [Lobosporangium transversale]XP_021885172.1 hypothetical protein BCR41DRAFT_392775 [Lobosporangium transversale]KAF9897234.1 hypothetical protein BX616_005945 [Lobosporangium transversale]ORZ10005.1 hypothetical protein BCR41DRAFT_398538 [Lobosporangium transversale]ORZ27445.1 hypothetical protein BCR41DRAFT_392775 [Lobosporangium transversale]|eukprot:XP_021879095.1 hypothetical protein BCR41DRAFT_398538 [Lobosporangium transversale]
MASSSTALITTTITAISSPATMAPHSIRKRKEPSDPLTQHNTQLSKKRRYKKKQRQRKIEDKQYSTASTIIDLTIAAMATTSSSIIMVSHSVATSGPVPRHVTVKKTQPNLISNSIGGNNSDVKDAATKALTTFTSGSSAFRARNIMESYTRMVPPSLNANTANGASSSSSWTRSFKYNNCSPNTVVKCPYS